MAIAQKNNALSVSPATGRADVAAWLQAPSLASLEPLLRGVQPEDGSPCLNAWGLSMDDAAVLPVTWVLLKGSADQTDHAKVRCYVELSFAKAGIPPFIPS